MQGGLRKKKLIFSFVKLFIENDKYYTHCFLVFLPKIKSRGVFQTECLLFTVRGYVQGALRKKELIHFFV